MKAEKSIDLGKLQDDLGRARAMHRQSVINLANANRGLSKAQDNVDAAKRKAESAASLVDKLQASVLEAARTVANG